MISFSIVFFAILLLRLRFLLFRKNWGFCFNSTHTPHPYTFRKWCLNGQRDPAATPWPWWPMGHTTPLMPHPRVPQCLRTLTPGWKSGKQKAQIMIFMTYNDNKKVANIKWNRTIKTLLQRQISFCFPPPQKEHSFFLLLPSTKPKRENIWSPDLMGDLFRYAAKCIWKVYKVQIY